MKIENRRKLGSTWTRKCGKRWRARDKRLGKAEGKRQREPVILCDRRDMVLTSGGDGVTCDDLKAIMEALERVKGIRRKKEMALGMKEEQSHGIVGGAKELDSPLVNRGP